MQRHTQDFVAVFKMELKSDRSLSEILPILSEPRLRVPKKDSQALSTGIAQRSSPIAATNRFCSIYELPVAGCCYRDMRTAASDRQLGKPPVPRGPVNG